LISRLKVDGVITGEGATTGTATAHTTRPRRRSVQACHCNARHNHANHHQHHTAARHSHKYGVLQSVRERWQFSATNGN
jgi:hypothetical protein